MLLVHEDARFTDKSRASIPSSPLARFSTKCALKRALMKRDVERHGSKKS
jgi:hypothetical protein